MASYEIRLKNGNDILYPQAVAKCIDVSNILASAGYNKNTFEWTATEDCYVCGTSLTNVLTINNAKLYSPSGADTFQGQIFAFMKKGDTFKKANNYGSFNIFGFK